MSAPPEQSQREPRERGHHALFNSFVMAGYECSSQRRQDGRRLDLLAATGHARWAHKDYAQLAGLNVRCARDGLRWHLIERSPGRYDWSSFLPMLRAARDHQVQVIWDLCHYGYPDDLDVWRPSFVDRFARFAGAVAGLMSDEGISVPFYSPVNEISFWSWAGATSVISTPMPTGAARSSSTSWCAPASPRSRRFANARRLRVSCSATR